MGGVYYTSLHLTANSKLSHIATTSRRARHDALIGVALNDCSRPSRKQQSGSGQAHEPRDLVEVLPHGAAFIFRSLHCFGLLYFRVARWTFLRLSPTPLGGGGVLDLIQADLIAAVAHAVFQLAPPRQEQTKGKHAV